MAHLAFPNGNKTLDSAFLGAQNEVHSRRALAQTRPLLTATVGGGLVTFHGAQMATVPTAQELLDAAKIALLRLLGGFSEAEFNGRRYREHDIDKLRRIIADLEAEVARTTAGGMRVRTVVPRG